MLKKEASFLFLMLDMEKQLLMLPYLFILWVNTEMTLKKFKNY